MTYRLHNRLGSGGFVIEACLAACDIEFAYEPIRSVPDQPLGSQVHDLNLWGQVPVLELHDGAKITEVAAILAHLSYAEPTLKHGPDLWIDDHPQFLRWSVFLSVNVYEGILRRSYTSRYYSKSADTGAGASPEDSDAFIASSIRHAARKRVHDALLCIERETAHHKFLLSDRLSPCDVYLAMLYAWHNKQPDLPKCTWITSQVATHARIRAIWKRNFEDRLDFRWHVG
ncbi:MAG: glutathione S-transferase family protein [Pseudomonadota bacterium]